MSASSALAHDYATLAGDIKRWARELGFADAGIAGVEVAHEDHSQALESSEDWWTIALGSGYRGKITPDNRHSTRAACLAISSRTVPLPAAYALARRAR